MFDCTKLKFKYNLSRKSMSQCKESATLSLFHVIYSRCWSDMIKFNLSRKSMSWCEESTTQSHYSLDLMYSRCWPDRVKWVPSRRWIYWEREWCCNRSASWMTTLKHEHWWITQLELRESQPVSFCIQNTNTVV